MSDTGEHLLGKEHVSGNQGFGYVGRTNRGWAALPHGLNDKDGLQLLGFRTRAAARSASAEILNREHVLSNLSVSETYAKRPLYRQVDHREGEDRDFTVAIAGSRRHAGQGPFVYAVRAKSQEQAWSIALSTHIRREWDIDCYVVAERSFEGVYQDDFDYGRFDLRLQPRFWDKLQEIVMLIKAYDEADKDNRDEDGYVLDAKQSDHDHLVGDYEMDAFPLVEDLAHYAEYI
ncbi:hypothetical protein [Streptomyces sp. CB03238]|uniref:hypothetical protein n=1 Tax=Streptomyces sp. CB03238 TaxID=1907777 RepID=UPI000A0FFA24|nr:hypothetical protein [Streptomyces sp. CB03238]ORT58120.1 hypothetical protein BKD26_19610 [Streptomyces sp. CB03238]